MTRPRDPRPLEETWTARDLVVVDAAGWAVAHVVTSAEDAALIAAAPGLYRALEALEWVDSDTYPVPVCPRCGGCDPVAWRDHFRLPMGHRGDCPLDAALRKARGGS